MAKLISIFKCLVFVITELLFRCYGRCFPNEGIQMPVERQELIHEYIDVFGTSTISTFMADREYVGEVWFEDLIRKKVPFYIRIRENMKVRLAGKGIKKAFWLFNHLKTSSYLHYKGLVYLGDNLVYLSGIKTSNPQTDKIEFVLIASFNQQNQALINYKERWQIETMFRAMKSNGFNMEDTHLTDQDRLSTLVAIIAIAFVWAYLVGIDKNKNINPIKLKQHGRRAYSFFKYGLIGIAHAILNTLDTSGFNQCVKVLSCT